LNDNAQHDPRLVAIPDTHGHAKGEHKAFSDERPIPLSARMLFLWFYHACRRGSPRFLMVSDHMNYLTFEDPAAINLVRRALKLAQAGDLYGAAETASVEVGHAAVVSEGLRRGMRYSIGAEVDNDPRSRPDAQNIVDAMKPDGMIRSVHFLTIDHPTHGPNWNWPFDNPEFAEVYELVGTEKLWELYMATLLDAIERLPGNIVGHFYVPALLGHWPDDATLEGYENQLVDACEARGMAIELNTRFLYREHSDEAKEKYLAAHRRLLAKCKAKNVGVAVGSDAHSPKDQGGAFSTVLALLDECEINELVFPIGGRLARVALRVERKVEPAPEPPSPAIEERRAARRARPVEPPPVKEEQLAVSSEDGEVPKVKPPRPKRVKVKAVEAVEPTAGAADAAGPAVNDGESPADEAAAAGELGAEPAPGSVADAPDAETVIAQESAADAEPESAAAPDAPEIPVAAPEIPVAAPEIPVAAPEIPVVAAEPEAPAAAALEAEPAVEQRPESPPEAADVLAVAAGLEPDTTSPAEVASTESEDEAVPAAAIEMAPEPTPVAEAELEAVEVVEVEIVDISEILVRAPLEEMVTDAEFELIVTEPVEEAADAESAEPEAASDEASAADEDLPVIIAAEPADIPALAEPEPGPAAVRKPRPKAGVKSKAPAKKATAKSKIAKPAAKPALKSAAKKAPAKPAAKKAAVKTAGAKPAVKNAAAKKAAPKKAPAKKTAIRASGTKKVSAKKAAAKKPAQRRR
jgi:HisJ family histidinol phosphate phosphatase